MSVVTMMSSSFPFKFYCKKMSKSEEKKPYFINSPDKIYQ